MWISVRRMWEESFVDSVVSVRALDRESGQLGSSSE